MRTGVIQPLPGIGDMVWFLPALRALAAAAADGRLTLLTRSSCQPHSLFHNEPMIERIVILPRGGRGGLSAVTNLWKTWKAVRQAKLDRLYVLHHSSRYRLAARLAGVRDVVAYPPLRDKVFIDGWVRSRTFLKNVGVTVEDPTPRLTVAASIVEAVRRRFHDCPRPWIIMSAGASEPVRRWPPENFARVAQALTDKTPGTVFLSGAPGDAEIVARVQDACAEKRRLVPVVGHPLEEVMALMSDADCLVGNDSGPPNLSAAMGCLTFSLYGRVEPPLHSPLLNVIGPPPGMDVRGIEVPVVIETVLAGLAGQHRL
ncbi:MAG TPA: glycosyltransferase family 9 protein [Candidatus Sulfotelmatobacter sp.]|jgi:heptosyltransferase-2|nr:glycosyltransferase family 9 protein [Candidatus Sulfotelmatobacter sp.]